MWAATLGLVLTGVRGSASGDEPSPQDGAPRGMVAYFLGSACPLGWTPSSLAQGRLAVGVTDAANVGTTVGNALTDREDRAHTHGFSGNLVVTSRSVVGASGSNNAAASSGSYPVMGTSAPATTGLPLVQLLACERP